MNRVPKIKYISFKSPRLDEFLCQKDTAMTKFCKKIDKSLKEQNGGTNEIAKGENKKCLMCGKEITELNYVLTEKNSWSRYCCKCLCDRGYVSLFGKLTEETEKRLMAKNSGDK